MKRKKSFMRWLATLLTAVMMLTPAMNVSAAKTYSEADMFKNSPLKGVQGAEDNTVYGGIDHTLCSFFLDDAIKSPDSLWATNGWIAPYYFEGEAFYFGPPPGFGFIPLANNNEMSINIVFLLRKTTDDFGNDSSFLIDPASNEDGHKYYAPNTDLNTYGGRAMRAYWHYLMEWLVDSGYHIDNFILGNEVNMPNQWHYSGNSDSGDAYNTATKYADAFYQMWSTVRKYTNISRCSVCVDHSWQNDNEGRGIAAKEFLHIFNDRLETYQSGVDWCVSTHLYPAQLFDTEIWNDPHNLAPNSPDARIVDGSNLAVMTNYIRETWGEEHRVMLTEQGFSDEKGGMAQAACLAYTFYAGLYDPMVDCFIINTENAGNAADGESLNFSIEGTLAGEVYTKIGNGNEADQQWIADVCLPVIGVSSWEEIIPNFGQVVDKNPGPEEIDPEKRVLIEGFVNRMYEVALERSADADGLLYWTENLGYGRKTGAQVAYSFIFSDEFKNKNYCNEHYIMQLYRAFMGREYDADGLSYWMEALETGSTREAVFNGFSQSNEFKDICSSYGIELGAPIPNPQYGTVPMGACSVDGREDGVTSFVKRLYNICLDREAEADGLNYYTQRLWNHESSGLSTARGFVFSPEFVNKNHSDADYIEYLYEAFMGRSSDADGKAYWLERIAIDGFSREDVFNGFAYSPEFTRICNSYGIVCN